MDFVHLHADRIKVDPKSECWLWIGNVQKANGYGYYNKKRAHRWVWEQLVGPLAREEHLDHIKCDNKICVNPDHLKKTNPSEHNRRHKLGKKMNLSPEERQRRREHGSNMIHHASKKAYSKRTRSEASQEVWRKRSPERRAEIGAKISAAKRGDAKNA